MNRFATIKDVIDHITPAFGEYAADFDIDAIAREVSDYRTDEFPGHPGSTNLNTAGFEVVIEGDEFWEVAAHHTI